MELLSLTRSVFPSLLHLVRKKEREAVAFPFNGKPYRNGRITLEMSQDSSPLPAFSSHNCFLRAVQGLLGRGKAATAIPPISHPICDDSRLPLSLQVFIWNPLLIAVCDQYRLKETAFLGGKLIMGLEIVPDSSVSSKAEKEVSKKIFI